MVYLCFAIRLNVKICVVFDCFRSPCFTDCWRFSFAVHVSLPISCIHPTSLSVKHECMSNRGVVLSRHACAIFNVHARLAFVLAVRVIMVPTLEPRTEKEIAIERKNLTFRILLNWWHFGLMVSWSSSAKDFGADESLIFSMYCPDGATLPYRAAGWPYWIIVSEIACHFLTIAFSVLGSRVRSFNQ